LSIDHFLQYISKGFSRITMALAPESRNWCDSSRGARIDVDADIASGMATMVTANCGMLGNMMATVHLAPDLVLQPGAWRGR
jgi:hypothetical protein